MYNETTMPAHNKLYVYNIDTSSIFVDFRRCHFFLFFFEWIDFTLNVPNDAWNCVSVIH